MTTQRVNVYLPYTLAKTVQEAREAGRPLNLSHAAGCGIRQALGQPVSGDGHARAELVQLADRIGLADQHHNTAHQGASVRLASIEQQIRLMALAFLALLAVSAMTFVSVRTLRTA